MAGDVTHFPHDLFATYATMPLENRQDRSHRPRELGQVAEDLIRGPRSGPATEEAEHLNMWRVHVTKCLDHHRIDVNSRAIAESIRQDSLQRLHAILLERGPRTLHRLMEERKLT